MGYVGIYPLRKSNRLIVVPESVSLDANAKVFIRNGSSKPVQLYIYDVPLPPPSAA
jgi:hypothetical protein